jgi:carbon-monoxide dehydrogenase small subunit
VGCILVSRPIQPLFSSVTLCQNSERPASGSAGKWITKVDIQGGFMSEVTLTVNGRTVGGNVEDRTLLVHFLRENLGLTGTHVGCDTSQCGACVVHVDGKAVKSCTMLAVQASGSTVITIEGLANGADLHPVQAAFKEHHGLQCGFCTPGMIMAATDMIARHPEGLDERTVRAELEGNICRCTGYHNIVKAILAAAQTMAAGGTAKAA